MGRGGRRVSVRPDDGRTKAGRAAAGKAPAKTYRSVRLDVQTMARLDLYMGSLIRMDIVPADWRIDDRGQGRYPYDTVVSYLLAEVYRHRDRARQQRARRKKK